MTIGRMAIRPYFAGMTEGEIEIAALQTSV